MRLGYIKKDTIVQGIWLHKNASTFDIFGKNNVFICKISSYFDEYFEISGT